jgi:hypothetical protein
MDAIDSIVGALARGTPREHVHFVTATFKRRR